MKILLGVIGSILFSALSYADHYDTLSGLSLREKIGQLCIVAAVSNEESNTEMLANWAAWQPLYRLDTACVDHLIADCGVGGVIFYGKHTLPQQQLELTKHFQSLSKIPLLVALDAECGLTWHFEKGSVLRFPFNMTLGAVHDESLTYQAGFEIGQQLKAIGVHINFAPVVDVNNNPKNPIIGMRSFGSDKHLVAEHGIALMQGLQDAGIIACAKHFPGHGDTAVDSHMALPLIPHQRERLDSVELFPFKKLIEAGVRSVMLAHLEVPALESQSGLPSSLSRAIVTDLLQHEMGFKGLVITDALGMKGVADAFEPGLLEVKALQAGADVLLCPVDPAKAIDSIEQAVKRGVLSEDEIDKKVLKVLQAKAWAFKHEIKEAVELEKRLHSEQAVTLKRLLYSKAVTLVKSDGQDFADRLSDNTLIVSFGDELIPFETALKGFNFRSVRLPKDLREKDINDFTPVIHGGHAIIGIDEGFAFKKDSAVTALQKMIKILREHGISITVVLFCSPYHLDVVNEADNLIVAYENDPDAQTAAAEVICGVRTAEGILPVDIELLGKGHQRHQGHQ